MPITPEMEKEVAQMRQQVRKILTEAQERAQKSGKPLLIMAGESHYNKNSILLQCIIYEEARAVGIHDFAIEQAATDAETKEYLEKTPLSRAFCTGQSVLFKQALYHNDQRHFVDDLHASATPKAGVRIDSRNEPMAENLSHIPRSVFLTTGAQHLEGLNTLMGNQDTHEVVSFDVTNNNHVTRPSYKTDGSRILSLSFDARNLSLNEVLRLGLSSDRFTHWAEKNDHKLTQEKARNTTNGFWLIPHTEASLPRHALHLYELGQDAQAGRYLATALHEAQKNPLAYKQNWGDITEGMFKDLFSAPFCKAFDEQMKTHKSKENIYEELLKHPFYQPIPTFNTAQWAPANAPQHIPLSNTPPAPKQGNVR